MEEYSKTKTEFKKIDGGTWSYSDWDDRVVMFVLPASTDHPVLQPLTADLSSGDKGKFTFEISDAVNPLNTHSQTDWSL